MKKLTIYLLLPLLLLAAACANKVAPSGGTKDATPPRLLSAVPDTGSVQFTASQIVLTFNEYVQLKDLTKQLVISPPLEIRPTITASGKKIIIRPEGLAAATTYTISFGNSIADITEGNALADFRYVFSTGQVIDTLTVSGTIRHALFQHPEKGALAILYDADTPDSLLLRTRPAWFARCNDNGSFTIRNIRPGSYRLFALSDKNDNYLLDGKDELAGFYDDVITLPTPKNYDVFVNRQPPLRTRALSSSLTTPGTITTVFNHDARTLQHAFQNFSPETVTRINSENGDTVYLHVIPAPADTLRIIWSDGAAYADTVTALYLRKSSKKGETKETLSLRFAAGRIPEYDDSLAVVSDVPLTGFDAAQITLQRDSADIPFNVLMVEGRLHVTTERSAGDYRLRLNAGALTDMFGRKSDSATFVFTIPAVRSRGSLAYRFTGTRAEGKLLQLTDEKGNMVRERHLAKNPGDIFQMLNPGKYRLRIITDTNGNSRWDGSDYHRKVRHEHVYYHPDLITVRANWEVEVEVTGEDVEKD